MKTKTKIKHEALKTLQEREMTNEVQTLPPNLKKNKHGACTPRSSNSSEELRAKRGGGGSKTGVAREKLGRLGD